MPAGEKSVFTVSATINPKTYERLVGDRFSVDSYTRLKRDIEADDLNGADERTVDFYNANIRPDKAVIAPQAYDIVIFQKLGHPVQVKSESIKITPGHPANEQLAKEVLWFFGQPEEFFLNLSYSEVCQDSPALALR